jgi:hypothetical protein
MAPSSTSLIYSKIPPARLFLDSTWVQLAFYYHLVSCWTHIYYYQWEVKINIYLPSLLFLSTYQFHNLAPADCFDVINDVLNGKVGVEERMRLDCFIGNTATQHKNGDSGSGEVKSAEVQISTSNSLVSQLFHQDTPDKTCQKLNGSDDWCGIHDAFRSTWVPWMKSASIGTIPLTWSKSMFQSRTGSWPRLLPTDSSSPPPLVLRLTHAQQGGQSSIQSWKPCYWLPSVLAVSASDR